MEVFKIFSFPYNKDIPFYWKDEASGNLPKAVESYFLSDDKLSNIHLALSCLSKEDLQVRCRDEF